jgi:D-alanyl-D-alanine endopeptidase (penicillin-binding protein 7)
MILGFVVIAVFLVTMTARAQQLTADSPGNAAAAPAASALLPALPAAYVPASQIVRYSNPNKLFLRSSVALIMDEREGVILHGRNIDRPRPIASLTKLMTALVILDTRLLLDETIEITRVDRDRLRGTKSRLRYGTILTRHDALLVALAASDNRAAAALARTYPNGRTAMIAAMNGML